MAGADAFFEVPSVAWQAGEYLLSTHRFEADALAPGRYRLLLGIYHEESGERLPIDAPDNVLLLGELSVE